LNGKVFGKLEERRYRLIYFIEPNRLRVVGCRYGYYATVNEVMKAEG
jgi:hypothetical protein